MPIEHLKPTPRKPLTQLPIIRLHRRQQPLHHAPRKFQRHTRAPKITYLRRHASRKRPRKHLRGLLRGHDARRRALQHRDGRCAAVHGFLADVGGGVARPDDDDVFGVVGVGGFELAPVEVFAFEGVETSSLSSSIRNLSGQLLPSIPFAFIAFFIFVFIVTLDADEILLCPRYHLP